MSTHRPKWTRDRCGLCRRWFRRTREDSKFCCKRHRQNYCERQRRKLIAPEYNCWRGMRRRCLDPRVKAYKYYGARGITVCERWLNSFQNFLADMGPRPSKMHSIERLDNDGNYSPSNCCWATELQQANNNRNCRYLHINGERITVAEASRRYGLLTPTIVQRLNLGWPDELAILPTDPQLSAKMRAAKAAARIRKQGIGAGV